MSELDFINHIKKLQRPLGGGDIGIGDDAAVIQSKMGGDWVVATDMIVENRHFDLKQHSLESIGRKAIAVNLSDMAAMAAVPLYALVSIAFPEGFGRNRVENLWSGLQKIADEFNVIVIGGDTNSWSGGLVVNVCMIGVPPLGGCIPRSRAKQGDDLYVTGTLGGSLQSNHHLHFVPKIKEAAQLLKVKRPTAMIDISDGLATDLNHICHASGVGADLVKTQIPISSNVSSALNADARLQRALCDGEDFELLFTLPPSSGSLLEALPFKCYQIGSISALPGIRMDGQPIEVRGFEHGF